MTGSLEPNYFSIASLQKKIDVEVIKRVKFTFFNHNNAV